MKKNSLMRLTSVTLGSITVALSFFCSCKPVKEYQKNKLNDAEMTLSNRKLQKTELNAQSYREGASGANGSKTGGGCGCN
jgi:hypothetical protein